MICITFSDLVCLLEKLSWDMRFGFILIIYNFQQDSNFPSILSPFIPSCLRIKGVTSSSSGSRPCFIIPHSDIDLSFTVSSLSKALIISHNQEKQSSISSPFWTSIKCLVLPSTFQGPFICWELVTKLCPCGMVILMVVIMVKVCISNTR